MPLEPGGGGSRYTCWGSSELRHAVTRARPRACTRDLHVYSYLFTLYRTRFLSNSIIPVRFTHTHDTVTRMPSCMQKSELATRGVIPRSASRSELAQRATQFLPDRIRRVDGRSRARAVHGRREGRRGFILLLGTVVQKSELRAWRIQLGAIA